MRLENEYGRKQLLGTKISSEHDWASPYGRKRESVIQLLRYSIIQPLLLQ